ncbi:PREDICTED: alpha carbonic anhydrase 4-like isoform X2 [Lupinus angustifolius]|uniref:alpha carbonic anhydrase 4-like isoform X2 n=1 Tax=Lupinus angustifolius TaxID=3871 RepID=UPI00092F3085|nr:PREDICTED: alpha carbonic anhydrase 4-like isoform X2 [Lupinus angustifolius]
MTLSIICNLFSLLLLVFISSSFLTISEAGTDEKFTYTEGNGKGPKNWGNINPNWTVCGNGKSQSPIDIVDERVQVLPQLGRLKRYYKPAPAALGNKGHSITLKWNGDAGKININGTNYNLMQFHWHTPSEHTLNGSKFDLELHAVHQNSKEETAVIGVWYKIGLPDSLLSKLLNDIKSVKEQDIDVGIINPKLTKFGNRKYYRYFGSFTTPPCTEGVTWTIMKKVRTISVEQLNALKEAVHPGFEENARATQELNGRQVYLYTPQEGKSV